MPYLSERSPIPVVPPGEDELPCDDGQPMETERHREQMVLLFESLRLAWKDRRDFYVGGNMFVYFSEVQVKHNDVRGPDMFVVLGVERREHKSWVVWQEGKAPDVVIELISEATEAVDRGAKMEIYARCMRVPFYFLFDPITAEFEGFRLDGREQRYHPLAADARGDLPCELVGFSLGIRRGVRARVEAPWLRWIDAEGQPLPTGEDLATIEAQRAESEAKRAESEAARARDLAEELLAYQRRFGPLDRGER